MHSRTGGSGVNRRGELGRLLRRDNCVSPHCVRLGRRHREAQDVIDGEQEGVVAQGRDPDVPAGLQEAVHSPQRVAGLRQVLDHVPQGDPVEGLRLELDLLEGSTLDADPWRVS